MSDLEKIFERLGLVEYLDAFIAEGFDTWDTVLDITEEDFEQLNVRRGHRRRLQREIANSRGIPIGGRLYSPGSHADTQDGTLSGDTTERPPIADDSSQVHPAKRRYRRHPKPDENAPKRPASAYVLFSNAVREELKDEDHTFVEFAKLVGERWQSLPAPQKEVYESTAAAAKDKYNADNAKYRRTQEYRNYRLYIDEFRAKANANTSANETKAPRLIHSSTQGSSTGTSAGSGPRVQGVSPIDTSGWQRQDNIGDYRGREQQIEARPHDGIGYASAHRPLESGEPTRSPTNYSMMTSPSTSSASFSMTDPRSRASPALPAMATSLPRASPAASIPMHQRSADQYLPHPSSQAGPHFARQDRLPAPTGYMPNPGFSGGPIESSKFTFSPPNLQSTPNVLTARGPSSVLLPPINSSDLVSPRVSFPSSQSIFIPGYQSLRGIGQSPAPSRPPRMPHAVVSQDSGSGSNQSRTSEISGPGPPVERSVATRRSGLDGLSVLALAGGAVEDESMRKLSDGTPKGSTQ